MSAPTYSSTASAGGGARCARRGRELRERRAQAVGGAARRAGIGRPGGTRRSGDAEHEHAAS